MCYPFVPLAIAACFDQQWTDTFVPQMRATKDRLQEEKYLVVVARELAKALKGLHEAGIIHRDVKGM